MTLYEQFADQVVRAVKSMVERMLAPLAEQIKSIPAGRDGAPGADGKSVDMDEVRKQIAEEVAKIPAPQDGKPGADGQKGADGEKGEKGEPGEKGEQGRDGRDGQRGEPGKDALQIEVLSTIDEEKSYQRGTWAFYKGGTWRASKTTKGMDGWECSQNGVQNIAIVQDPDDPRRIAIGIKQSNGEIVEQELHIPMVLYKGVFKEGEPYRQGDAVTWARHLWIAGKDTTDKPDFGGSWRLAVKGGRDGSNGRDGIDRTGPVKL